MYRDIEPYDSDRVLQHEFLNSRGAIARFDRNTIEIRVLDVQECPQADLAICESIVGALKLMIAGRWTTTAEQKLVEVEPLAKILTDTTRDAEKASIECADVLRHFGIEANSASAADVWRSVAAAVSLSPPSREVIDVILNRGPLARRVLAALDGDLARIGQVYRTLCDCLHAGKVFET
jgi:hypothetical protein